MHKTDFGSLNDLVNINDDGKKNKHAADTFSSTGSASFKMMAQRFKTTTAIKNSQFILTILEDGVG